MDTSKEYIELCGKATEVQLLRIPIWGFCNFEIGDLFHRLSIDYWFDGEKEQPKTDGTTWLPRQDQLQDIIIDKYKEEEFPIYVMLECMYNYEGGLGNSSEDRSLEQAWLAFVMIEKYNKQWNSETKEWEKS